MGLSLTAFVSITPLDPAAPDDAPDRLATIPEIEACHSVAGDESYILKVRVASPTRLEDLLARIRATANVQTRTTIVLSTFFEGRPSRLTDRSATNRCAVYGTRACRVRAAPVCGEGPWVRRG